MEIGNVNNPMAGALAGATKAEEVEKKDRKVLSKETSPKAVGTLPDMPNPAAMTSEEIPQESNLMQAFSQLLKEIDNELKNQIAVNIKRATKEEISPKAREHLKTAFDHLKTVHKQVQEMASQIA
jgi:hypothetical protein